MPKIDTSLALSGATAAVVLGVFNGVAPSIADVSAAPVNDDDVFRNTKTAGWIAAGTVGAISLLAKDPTPFVIGGSLTLAYMWWLLRENSTSPIIEPLVQKVQSVVPKAEPMESAPSTDYSSW